MEIKMETDEVKDEEKINIEKLRNILQKRTKIIDGHLVWDSGPPTKGHYFQCKIVISPTKKVYPHFLYKMVQDYDKNGEFENDQNLKLIKTCSVELCVMHFAKRHKNIKNFADMDADDQLHELDRIEKMSKDEKCLIPGLNGNCQIWIGACNKLDHPRISLFGKTLTVSRVVYLLHHFGTELDENISIYHLCKNPKCVNIDHLMAMDQKTIARKRKKVVSRKAKLNEEKVKQIVKDLCEKKSTKELVEKYHVSISTINFIRSGRSWTRVVTEEERKLLAKTQRTKRGGKLKYSTSDKENVKKAFTDKKYVESAQQRLKENCTIKTDDDGQEHWIYKFVRKDGYGQFSIKGRSMRAHVASYLLHNNLDSIPENQMVRHKCRNTMCVNPDHIELGTAKENAKDRERDGTVQIGEKNVCAKITEEIAKKIKASKGKETQPQRAKDLNVSLDIIKDIDRDKTWKHV